MQEIGTLNINNLSNTKLFSEGTMKKLKNSMCEKKVQSGGSLFEVGDEADKLYFVKEGIVRLIKVMEDGTEMAFYHFHSGDMFGEYEYIQGNKCIFSARVLVDCKIGVIMQRDLEVLLRQDGDLAIEFMKWMGYMRQFTQMKLRDLIFFGKNGALASTLIRMANTYGKADGKSIYITRKFTNEMLANLIGATRETVNRLINQLKKERVLEYDNGFITILNIDYLRNMCHCENCLKYICRL